LREEKKVKIRNRGKEEWEIIKEGLDYDYLYPRFGLEDKEYSKH